MTAEEREKSGNERERERKEKNGCDKACSMFNEQEEESQKTGYEERLLSSPTKKEKGVKEKMEEKMREMKEREKDVRTNSVF